MLERIVTGGQTGVDRAALDVALELNIPCGGWCPKGRLAEDGRIADHYPLRETRERDTRQRTEWNVRDSDATLILSVRAPEGGTAFTRECTEHYGRPCLMVSPQSERSVARVGNWLDCHPVHILNIAGSRESEQPGIFQCSRFFLISLFVSLMRQG